VEEAEGAAEGDKEETTPEAAAASEAGVVKVVVKDEAADEHCYECGESVTTSDRCIHDYYSVSLDDGR